VTDSRLLHYRAWRGELHAPAWSVWPIARVAVTMIFRRKLFWVIYVLSLFIFLFFFFGQYFLDWAETQLGENKVGFGFGIRLQPEVVIGALKDGLHLNGTAVTYSNYFWYQGWGVMVILALAGAILVGNDFHFGSLSFYLSKPLSSWHYLLGKCLGVAAFVNLMTTMPAIVLYVQYSLLSHEAYFFARSRLLLGIVGYGLLLTVFLSLLLVATASWLKRTVPLIMMWTTLLFFFRQLGGFLARTTPTWRLIDLWNDTYLLGCWCLGMEHDTILSGPHPSYLEAALVLGAICLLCLTYLILRIRAVEIVR
jgi:ABC-type transport system involved in multi-copper enzyme maturation permease subunit